jgi:hypothetical protein
VGKRSRRVAARRKRKHHLEELIGIWAERGRLTLAFCRAAAVFADNRIYERFGSASAVEWLCENCHMTEQDAADSIAIGRRMEPRSP